MPDKCTFQRVIDGADGGAEAHIIIGVIAALVGLGLEIYSIVVQGNHFSLTTYGQGVGWLLLGMGGAAAGQGIARKNERAKND